MENSSATQRMSDTEAKDPWVVLFWDFFGPNALPTAQHFEKHMREFFAREQLDPLCNGLISEQDGHTAYFCICEQALEPVLLKSLRPRRKSSPTELHQAFPDAVPAPLLPRLFPQ